MVEAAPVLGKYSLLSRRAATVHVGSETWEAIAPDGSPRLVFRFVEGASAIVHQAYVRATLLGGVAGVVPVVDGGSDGGSFVVVSPRPEGISIAETLAELRWLDEDLAHDVIVAVAEILDRLRLVTNRVYLPRAEALWIVREREALLAAPLDLGFEAGDPRPIDTDLSRAIASFAFELLVGRRPVAARALPSEARADLGDVPDLPPWFDGWWTHAAHGGFPNIDALIHAWGDRLPILSPAPQPPHPPGGMTPIRPPPAPPPRVEGVVPPFRVSSPPMPPPPGPPIETLDRLPDVRFPPPAAPPVPRKP